MGLSARQLKNISKEAEKEAYKTPNSLNVRLAYLDLNIAALKVEIAQEEAAKADEGREKVQQEIAEVIGCVGSALKVTSIKSSMKGGGNEKVK